MAMSRRPIEPSQPRTPLVRFPRFAPGDAVRVAFRDLAGPFRVPYYLRGKPAVVEAVVEPDGITVMGTHITDPRVELCYYRIAIAMSQVWPGYTGSPRDGLRIEIYEASLERI